MIYIYIYNIYIILKAYNVNSPDENTYFKQNNPSYNTPVKKNIKK